MGQFKLVSVHTLGQGVLWHGLWGGYHHAAVSHCTEDYLVRLFWHFMRFPHKLAVASSADGTELRPLWGGRSRPGRSGSFLLSCHLLCYQDWLLCFMTYAYTRGGRPRARRSHSRGLHNFL
jgi:hypothetical protein